jgi:serine/threonine protein kinase/WD40 repeat protein
MLVPMASDGLEEGAELFEFLDALARDRERGAERPLSEYLARHRRAEAAIAREWLAQRAPQGAERAPDTLSDELRVGPWRLVREIGRGGQGAVWLAEDTRFARKAALKLLPDAFALLDADRRNRLRREAEALARLEHPAICPVLEAEIEGARPYLAMRLIEGETLAAAIARARKGPQHSGGLAVAPRNRAELDALLAFFEEAARALHAAHEAGIVHRDIKPGNVMVTPERRPVLLDFGQARADSATLAAQSLSGEVVGTPAYMSPEQVRGRTREVDRRSDVWSLGATLYEALTLEKPFEGASIAELAMAIDRGPLPMLRSRAIPRDLAVVLEKALERDLLRRYATALDLAEDLRRVRVREPVRARPAGPMLRLGRWTQRHPAIAASLFAVLVSLSGGLLWSIHLLRREARALDFALASHLAQRTVALIDEDPSAALALGIEAVELAPNFETRSALLEALRACSLETLIEAPDARRILDLALDAGGTRAALATDVGSVVLFDLERRALAGEVRLGAAVNRVRFLPSAELAAACADGRLRFVDIASLAVAREVEGPGGALLGLALDPAGERLALSATDGGIALLSLSDGSLQSVPMSAGGCDTLRFSPDGQRLLAFRRALPGNESRAADLALLAELDPQGIRVRFLASGERLAWAELLPQRSAIAMATLGGRVAVWSIEDGVELAALDEPAGGPVWCVAASGDGAWLAIAREQPAPGAARVELWNPWEGTRLPLESEGQARVVHVAFAPDGARLAASSFDATVRVFDVASARALQSFRSMVQPLESLWSPDGARLLTFGNGNSAPVWLAHGPPDAYALVGHGAPVTRGRFAPDGARALTLAADGTARLWSTAFAPAAEGPFAPAGFCLASLGAREHGARVGVGFCRASGAALCWSDGGELESWDALGRAALQAGAAHAQGLRGAELDPAGQGFAFLDRSGGAWLRARLADGRAPIRLGEMTDATSVAFSPDGQRIAVGARSGALYLFERGGAPLGAWRGAADPSASSAVVDLVFAPDSLTLALACADRKVRFLHLAPELAESRPPLVVFPPLSIDWSSDGSRLLVVGTEGVGAFRLFDLERNQHVRLEVFHGGNLTCGEFSPDGKLALSGSLDGTVYVRSALDGTPVARLAGHGGAVLDASFSSGPGPLRVLTASSDGSARVWPLDPLAPAKARQPRTLKNWEREREARLAEPLHYR